MKRSAAILCMLVCCLALLAACNRTSSKPAPSTTPSTEDDGTIKVESIAKISGGQDGAIFQDMLFRFNGKGSCNVYNLTKTRENKAPYLISTFSLDLVHMLSPHSNSVMFGNEYYSADDQFPLLYCNIYNNYANAEDKMEGTTCVYRIQRSGGSFTSTLVQIIEIGFTDDRELWRSATATDKRPYGNFVIDRENGIYYAFTMRDEDKKTRFFAFDLPKVTDGTLDKTYGVNRVVLEADSIKGQFDCDYSNYLQGATCHDGKIYSLEGAANAEVHPKLRIFDPVSGTETLCVTFFDFGLYLEPEMIDFTNNECYYCDASGNLYKIIF